MAPTLIPDPIVARERYHRSLMSLWRWDHTPALGFPRPVKICGRNYRRADELDEFDARRAAARNQDEDATASAIESAI